MRDDFTCQYCGRAAPLVKLEVDHVVARSRGGKNAPDNLITACFDCNQGKKAMQLSADHVKRFTKPELPKAPRVAMAHRQSQGRTVTFKKPAKRQGVTFFHAGAPLATRYKDDLPISDRFVYVADDTFIGSFICKYCGFTNTYEGDMCSCRRRREEAEEERRCELCEESLEWDDEEICRPCYDRLYVYCWGCEENEQKESSNYCAQCLAKDRPKFVGGVPL